LISERHNTVHSCSRRGMVAARLTSERPGSVIPGSKNIYCTGSTFIAAVTADVYETDTKGVVVHARCFHTYQISSLPPGSAIRKWYGHYQRSPWDADSLSAGLQTPGLEWNPKVH
jgi:hypothetical protein